MDSISGLLFLRMRDLVFLFGAGASFGAGGILPEHPPLGTQLLGELNRLYPKSWGALPLHTKLAFRNSFESGMAVVYRELPYAIPQLMREMAIYFAQFRIVDQSCAYSRLLSALERSGTIARSAFSTLNYECTLDFELVRRRYSINYFEASDAERIPLWKLHGSCNMFSSKLKVLPGIKYSTGINFEGGIEAFFDIGSIVEHCLMGTSLAPVMCLYMAGKPLNVSPSSIALVQSNWVATLLRASTVIVVGVRPWPADEHIWGPLARTDARLLCVGDSQAFSEWARKYRNGPSCHIGDRFNATVELIIQSITANGAF